MSSAVEEYDLTAADRFAAPLIHAAPKAAVIRVAHSAPFLFSIVLHLGAVLGLAAYHLPSESRGGRHTVLVTPAAKPVQFEKLTKPNEIIIDSNFIHSVSPVTATKHSGDIGESLPSPLGVISESGVRSAGASPLDDVMGLFKGDGLGFADAGQENGGAEFFGVKAAGRRFVFVVDSSRSMRGRKWALACRELIASVNRMNPQQSFFVIFFDIDTHPMFNQKKPERDLLPATSRNQKRLLRWLPSIKLGPETRPMHSMQLALAIKPDAIFLLSDGEFNDGTRDLLIGENSEFDDSGVRSPRTTVHTVGFHSLAAEASLKPIAAGKWRLVPIRAAIGIVSR